MQEKLTPVQQGSASLSRRNFMAAAAGSAATLPFAAPAAADLPELPIEAFERLANEVSFVLNGYLDGRFYAVIYPSAHTDFPIALKSIAVKQRCEPPLDVQIDECVEKLKGLLGQMYPGVSMVKQHREKVGNGYSFWMYGYAPPRVEWDEAGLYEIESGPDAGAGVYHIHRHWAEMDKKWMLFGAYIQDGYRVGPRVVIQPWQLVRKLEGGDV